MLGHLTDKINSLLQQNIALNKKISQDMEALKSPLRINVQIKSNKGRPSPAFDRRGLEYLFEEDGEDN